MLFALLALEQLFGPVLSPLSIGTLSIFRQDDRAGRFRVIADAPFAARRP